MPLGDRRAAAVLILFSPQRAGHAPTQKEDWRRVDSVQMVEDGAGRGPEHCWDGVGQ